MNALADSRKFDLGFTYQPYDWTEEAFQKTHQIITNNSDLTFIYFDDGVPWGEALSNDKYSDHVQNAVTRHLDRIEPNRKLGIGINFLGKDRSSLASYWGETDSMPLPNKWSKKRLDDPEVILAYINYASSMVDAFNPNYLIYGMEVDSIEGSINSAIYQQITNFVAHVYPALKSRYPKLPIMLSFVLGPDEHLNKRLEVTKSLLPFTDVYAVSAYPFVFDGVAGDSFKLPKNFFSRVRGYIGKMPFAVAETGFNAKPWKVWSRLIFIAGSEKSQANYVSFLLEESQKLNALFVNWWVPHDLDRLWEIMKDSGADIMLSQWNSNGLFDANGKPRESLDCWRNWLNNMTDSKSE